MWLRDLANSLILKDLGGLKGPFVFLTTRNMKLNPLQIGQFHILASHNSWILS